VQALARDDRAVTVVGVGVDLVDIARFERAMSRTPRLRERLFAEEELVRDGVPLPLRSLAGRFAAKEALVKALGGRVELSWRQMVVYADPSGAPHFALRVDADAVAAASVGRAHLSISHDAGMAIAFVVLEGGA